MISIAEAISDLLFVRDTVVVPGLGAFVKKAVPATVNPVANYFAVPSCQLEFNPNLREDNDLVIKYMAEENDIPEDEAKRLLMMFVSDCFNSLKSGKKVTLQQIGTLSYDWADDLVFQQDESVNYNADAFGLCDFSPVPVIQTKSKDEIKAEIEQEQKDKNTPITVDEKAVHEDDEKPDFRFGWLWVLLVVLLLLAGIGYGLHYFKVFDFKQWKWMERPEKPTEIEPWKVTHPSFVRTWKTEIAEPEVIDTIEDAQMEIVTETESVVAETEEVVPEAVETETKSEEFVPEQELIKPEANIRIIAGCFSQEENALRLANSLKDKGYKAAFVEKRGSKWFVAFGRYATDEDANAALRDIRATSDDKAWILK